MRFHMRLGERPTIASAKQILRRISALPKHEFWPDSASYLEIPEKGVLGHRQVIDAYLVSLAALNGGVLATMDEGIACVHAATLLI